jgi:hypothetical protein
MSLLRAGFFTFLATGLPELATFGEFLFYRLLARLVFDSEGAHSVIVALESIAKPHQLPIWVISANGSASHRISMIYALVRPIPIGIRWQDSDANNRQPPRTHFFAVVAGRD